MGAGHSHGGSGVVAGRAAGPHERRLLALVLVPIAVATLAGLVALWPGSVRRQIPPQFRAAAGPAQFVAGTVASVTTSSCGVDAPPTAPVCEVASVRLVGGPTVAVQLTTDATTLQVAPGEGVRVAISTDDTGAPTYYIADLSRGRPMGLLALLAAVVVVAVARLRGVSALLSLVVAGGVLVLFVLPALLEGHDPVLVALVGSSAVLFPALLLAHGPSARTCTALVGTLGGLALVTGLGSLAVHLTHLTGLSDENATTLRVFAGDLSATGIITCGLVVGALGALNDVTVTQASAVWELHAADGSVGRRALFASAMRVGRDHIGSSVYTLVFAYAGAALPVLLLLSLASRPVTDVLTGDLVATEIVRTLVGAIGLVLAVPVTTVVAVLVARGTTPPGSAPSDRPSHRSAAHTSAEAGGPA